MLINRNEAKIRLIGLGKTQVELVEEIRRRYVETLLPQEFNKILAGNQTGNKANRIKQEAEIILKEWENDKKNSRSRRKER